MAFFVAIVVLFFYYTKVYFLFSLVQGKIYSGAE